jgi:hypothetical protein
MTLSEWTPKALNDCLSSRTTRDVLGDTLKMAKRNGYWLEFGVATGNTLNKISKIAHQELPTPYVAGFDSFDGLPEDWEDRFPKGTFKQNTIPTVEGSEIVVGLFEQTLASWIESKKDLDTTLIHIDCDLYAGTKYVITSLMPYIKSGTYIVFDELLNYKGFEQHEWKALYECSVEEKLFNFEWISHQIYDADRIQNEAWQVAIKII